MPTDLPPPGKTSPGETSPGETSPGEPPSGEAEPVQPSIWQGLQGAIVLLSLLALLALLLLHFFTDRPGRGRALKVAILEPEFLGDALEQSRRALLAEAMLDTTERMLAARTGLIAERAPGLADAPSLENSRPEIDRARVRPLHEAGFDEVLSILVSCEEERCRAVLRRLRSVDASAEWRRSFRVDPRHLLALEDELAGELHVAYLKFSRRPDGARLLADAETYERFLRLRLDHGRGLVPTRRALKILDGLRAKAPRSTGLHLFAAELLAERGDLEGAAELLAEAQRIAPGDLRPPLERMPILLELGQRVEALETLAHLDVLIPDEPRLLTWREYVGQ